MDKRKPEMIVDESGPVDERVLERVREIFSAEEFPRTRSLAEEIDSPRTLAAWHRAQAEELEREIRGALVVAGSREIFLAYCEARGIRPGALSYVRSAQDLTRARQGSRVILIDGFKTRRDLRVEFRDLERAGYFGEVIEDEV